MMNVCNAGAAVLLAAAVCCCHRGNGAVEPSGEVDLLAMARTLDYRAPSEDVRAEARDRASQAYAEKCLAGDIRACARVDGDVTRDLAHEAAVRMAEACVKGDTWACVEVHRGEENSLMVPGALGSYGDACRMGDQAACDKRSAVEACMLADPPEPPSQPCQALQDAAPADPSSKAINRFSHDVVVSLCDRKLGVACRALGALALVPDEQQMAWVVQACALGDADGCADAARRADERGDTQAAADYRAQAKLHKSAECKRGIALSCSGDIRAQVAAQACKDGHDRACVLADSEVPLLMACSLGDGCSSLAELLRGEGQRDALEHGCQWGGRGDCVELVKGYQAKRWPEPVPGRRDALTAWLCSDRESEACVEIKQ